MSKDASFAAAVGTPDEALALARTLRFDVVVMPWAAPRSRQVMGQLHASYGMRGIAKVARDSAFDAVQAREAGFVAHVREPATYEQLLEAIRGLRE